MSGSPSTGMVCPYDDGGLVRGGEKKSHSKDFSFDKFIDNFSDSIIERENCSFLKIVQLSRILDKILIIFEKRRNK